MTNPHKGDVGIKVEDETLVLCYSTNGVAEAEDELGRPFMAMLAELQEESTQSIGTLRAIFWCGLLHHRPETTLRQAGEIMDKVSHTYLGERIRKSLELSFPARPKSKKKKQNRAERRAPATH